MSEILIAVLGQLPREGKAIYANRVDHVYKDIERTETFRLKTFLIVSVRQMVTMVTQAVIQRHPTPTLFIIMWIMATICHHHLHERTPLSPLKMNGHSVHVPPAPVEIHVQIIEPKTKPQFSPTRKRSRDDSDELTAATVIRVNRQRLAKAEKLPDNGQALQFLGHRLPNRVIQRIMSFLPEQDFMNITFYFLIPSCQRDIRELKLQHEKQECKKIHGCGTRRPPYTAAKSHAWKAYHQSRKQHR